LAAENRASDPAAAPAFPSERASETRRVELPFWCPSGYVPVSEVVHVVDAWIEQGHTFSKMPQAQEFLDELGRALSWAELPSYGVPQGTDRIIEIRTGAWRWRQPANGQEQFLLALQGYPIAATPYVGPLCEPVLKEADLAAWLGASFEPEPPKTFSTQSAEAKPAQAEVHAAKIGSQSDDDLSPSKQALLTAWVNGYAQAYKDILKDRVISRDEALEAVKKHNRGSVRAAREAFKALPHPTLRIAPVGER
jgi:hypothetical protein